MTCFDYVLQDAAVSTFPLSMTGVQTVLMHTFGNTAEASDGNAIHSLSASSKQARLQALYVFLIHLTTLPQLSPSSAQLNATARLQQLALALLPPPLTLGSPLLLTWAAAVMIAGCMSIADVGIRAALTGSMCWNHHKRMHRSKQRSTKSIKTLWSWNETYWIPFNL